MEHIESYSLKWDQFESNLGSKFADLRAGEHFSDVTLVSEDGQVVKAHKVLLSATSPLLEAILKSQDHPKPLIFMRGVHTDVLNSLLDFIYFGQVEKKSQFCLKVPNFTLIARCQVKSQFRNPGSEALDLFSLFFLASYTFNFFRLRSLAASWRSSCHWQVT